MQEIKAYIQHHQERFLDELIALLRIPSISADQRYKTEVLKTAQAFASRLQEAGLENVELLPTKGYPVVYGEKIIDPDKPTILVYGHYDVQPPDPLELWVSPPFEPRVQDGKIFARGACDDKGQVYMHIKAFESMVGTNTLPCNVKFIIEGEEEIGSAHLPDFISENKKRLRADVILISDTAMISFENPSLEISLRGLSVLEIEVTGPNRDLHSGAFGGVVANPAHILAKMIASLHDENNHITVPGFYDDVLALSPEERSQLYGIPYDEEAYKADLGVDELYGEEGYSTIERLGIRPTIEVNGMWSGYTGEGSKTVLPSKANAKISMRLVANQRAKKIIGLVTKYFQDIAPEAVKVKVIPHHGGDPYLTPVDSIAYRAAEKAMEESFGKKPLANRGGASIPIVALFERELGLKTILMGFGLNSDNLHSPNEKFDLANFYKGIETIPLFYKYFTEGST